MRKIKYIVVHCTAGRQTQSIDDLRREFKRKGWKNPGYHYVIRPDGSVAQLLSEDGVANGVRGYNSVGIHVAYIGGVTDTGSAIDNRTTEQKKTLRTLLKIIHQRYPSAIILGHRDLSPDLNHDGVITPNEFIKQCPCFDAKKEYSDV